MVRRISQIDDVRLLRSARETLTDHEESELKLLRLSLMERLDGALTTVAPPKTETKKGLLGALFSPLLAAAKGASKEMRAQGEFAYMVGQSGPARLPAPVELLDAAEAWAVSHIAADRVDEDLAVLRTSWDEASIEPVDSP